MKAIIYLLPLLFAFACLDVVGFDIPESSSLLVVDGVFTNSIEKDYVKLGFTTEYGLQRFIPISAAVVYIYNEQGEAELLDEVEAGVYEFKKDKIVGKIGEGFYLEIQLKEGQVYRSEMEYMPSVPSIDSLSFDTKIEEFMNDFGAVLDTRNFLLNIHTTINQETSLDFLKWEVEHVYYFPEVYNPPVKQKFCFVYEELEPQKIYLFNGTAFKADASIQEVIARKRMNHTFSFPQSYRVFQYGITQNAHNYFSKLSKVSNPNGNIFDTPPSAIKGNISRIDQEEQTLGYFSVASVESKIKFINIEDIQDVYRPIDLCNAKLLRVASPPLLPAECRDCLSIKNSTLERPFYW